MAIKWGTDSQVQYMDPLYKFPLQIGLSGEMALSVSDSRRLLVKLVGTEKSLTQESLMMKFRAVLNSKVKPYIASVMQSANYSIFEADAHMEEFSDALKDKLKDDFDDYGVSLDRFFVTNIAKPEGDYAYEQYKDIHVRKYTDVAQAQLKQQLEIIEQQTQAQKIVIESQAIAQKRAQEGYTYQQERGFDVSEKIAENEAVGEFTNLGVGFGTMAGIGGAVGGMVGGMVNDSINSSIAKPSNEGNELDTFKSKIEKLKIMKECGLLSDDEFIAKKQELLNEL